MLDWLRRKPQDTPTLAVGGRSLPLAIRRMAQARRMTLRLAPDGSEIRVTMPKWGMTQDALDFARARIDWIEGQLSHARPVQQILPGMQLPFRGRLVTLCHDPAERRVIRLQGDLLMLGGAVESIEPRLARWLKAQARELFAADLADYAARAGVPMPPLALSNARARWGSCSSTGAVRLNWRLVMAPDAVRRSVVAHEVAHLVHFDHSPRFHALLGSLFEGDMGTANSWLKRHGRSLYAHFA
ncbi:DUF45 domain-containing protein [Novosphingobium sp. FSY-8]|uniref:DUF45 domain-containing protein n=1 Tax=Novosphingobium ovatum TaxID=1908523 RepID=A0ABW9XFL5_9SPHN|nr:SprT family zinc-dependent metalloprotease [Novosphingobium ovatum]NBC37301.1 DUF45 domain-containing protein [Novosphingobium ovatum]